MQTAWEQTQTSIYASIHPSNNPTIVSHFIQVTETQTWTLQPASDLCFTTPLSQSELRAEVSLRLLWVFLNSFQGDHLTPVPFVLPWNIPCWPFFFLQPLRICRPTRGFSGQWCVCAVVTSGDRQWTGEGCEGWGLWEVLERWHERDALVGLLGVLRGSSGEALLWWLLGEPVRKLESCEVSVVNCESLYEVNS